MRKKNSDKELIAKVYSSPQYKGKHVVVIGGKIHTAKTGKSAAKMFEELTHKYPYQQPTITYIPKADTLILYS